MPVFRGLSAVVLCALFATVLEAAPDAERRLDSRLKMLYRAQRPERNTGLVARPEQAEGVVRRFQGGKSAAEQQSALLLLVKFTGDPARLALAGFVVESRIGNIYSGRLHPDRLAELAELPEIVFIQLSQEILTPPSPDRLRSRLPRAGGPAAAAPHSGPSLATQSLSGTGVIVAFIDTGVDICHLDFRKADTTTRIKLILDLSDPGDPDGDGQLNGSGPFGGTLYTEADINASLSTSGFCAGSASGVVAEKDTTGHGTHGLSVAAGDDASFPGVATDADLMVVKATRVDGTLGFQSTDILNALSFINQKAGELSRPYVANLSLGTIFSSHDGRSLEEQAIDALVGPGIPGKAVVLASGNSSDNRSARYHHFQGKTYVGLGGNHVLTLPAYVSPNPERGNDRMLLDIWHDGNDRNTITVTTPTGAVVSAAYGSFADVATVDGDVFIANMGGGDPSNGDTEIIVLIDDWSGTAPRAGNWTVGLEATQIGGSGIYHGWLADESTVGVDASGRPVFPHLSSANCDGRIPCEAVVDNDYLVAKPGAAYNGITVGSYAQDDAFTPTPASRFHTTWTDVNSILRTDTSAVVGDISDFSSTGRTRDGRVKPDLAAPGERVMGAVSRNAIPGVDANSIYQFHPFAEATALLTDNTEDHRFGMLQGTSFSAPVVTGLVARIFSTAPTLDAIQVRNILLNSALTDSFTGAVPNAAWGWGKASLSVGSTTPLPSNLRILTEVLPAGALNEQYNLVLTAAGGTLPYGWFLANGTTLPPGLTLSGSLITGHPTTAGTFSVDIQLADSSVPFVTQTKSYLMVITATPSLGIISDALPVARIDRPYAFHLEAEGGTAPYAWSLAEGSTLPVGLALTTSGAINGTPTSLGTTHFTARVTDAAATTVLRSLRIRVLGASGEDWTVLGKSVPTIRGVAIDPTDSRHLATYVTVAGGGLVFESLDSGDSWRAISVNNGMTGVHASDLGFSSTGTLWINVSEPGFATSSVFRFDRALNRWISTLNGASLGGDLDFDAAGGVYLLSSQTKTVRRSTNEGASWTVLGTPPGDNAACSVLYALSVFRSNPATFYLAGYDQPSSGLQKGCTFATQDGGATWLDVNNQSRGGLSMAVSQQDAMDVVKASFPLSGFPPPTIFWTRDGGRNWSQTSSPVIEPAQGTLARFPSNPSILYVGTLAGGLFKSTDSGMTWSALPGPPGSIRISTVAIDPTDPDVVFASNEAGLFRSPDGGLSWALKVSGLVQRTLNGLAISASAPDQLLLASAEGPFASRSAGQAWTLSGAGLTNTDIGAVVASAADPNLYYVVNADGLFRTDNAAVTWFAPNPSFTTGFSVVALAADPFNSNVAIVSLSGTRGSYRSVDRGATWTAINTGLPFLAPKQVVFASDIVGRAYLVLSANGGLYRTDNTGDSWSLFGLGGQTVNVVAPAPSDSEYVYASSGNVIYRRPGAATSWQAAAASPPSLVLALAVDPNDRMTAYAALDHPGTAGGAGGLYKTTDGGANWLPLPSPLSPLDVVSLGVHPSSSGVVYAAARLGGIYRTSDGGTTWELLSNYGTVADLANVNLQDPTNPFLLFAGTEGYGVQASTNRGLSYVPRVTGLTNYYINALAFDPAAPSTMYAASRAGIFKSTNSANSWSPTALSAGEVTDMLTDNQGTAKRIWATVRGQGVAYSVDGGTTFSVSSTGLASLELTGLDLETIGTAKRIWATTTGGDGVAFSDDLGATWQPAGGNGLTNRNVNSVTVQTGTAKRIWATTDNGVFFTDNEGLSWTDRSAGLPSGVPATSVAVDPGSNEVLVSLFSEEGGGVYRGGNTTGVWTPFNSGLDELKVRNLTNGPPRTVGANSVTTFYAATAGDGVFTTDLTTNMAGGPSISTSALPNGLLRRPYPLVTLAATGGTAPYFWSLQGGSLPAGLELNGAAGTISGEPGQIGSYNFTLQVSDASARIGRRAFSMQVVTPDTLHVVSCTPSSAVRGTSANVVVNGSSFQASSAVSFGADVTVNSVTFDTEYQLTANITVSASATPGVRTVTVTNPGPVSASLAGGFTVEFPSPVVSALGTTQGSRKDTMNVTINGGFFDNGAAANFGVGVTVNSTTYVNAGQLTANITIDAAAPLGARDVTVTNPNTLSGTLAGSFTVRVARPSVTGTNPAQANQGSTLTVLVNGADFVSGATTSFGAGVTVNGTSFVSAQQLSASVSVAANATLGLRAVNVTNPDGQQGGASGVFQVKGPAPQIFFTAPSTGVQGATLDVDVNGSNFQAGAVASFGAGITVNTSTLVSASKVTANVTIAPTAASGFRNVVVTNADAQTATLTSGFQVMVPAPTFASVTPNAGGQGSALNVVLAGTGFQVGAVANFGPGITVNATAFNSSTQLTAAIVISPGATLGLRSVTVTNPDTQTVTLSNAFEVRLPTPVITSIDPASIPLGQSETVLIKGVGFQSGAAVSLGTGITIDDVSVDSAIQLTVAVTVSSQAAKGARTVTVTNPDGQQASSSDFTVTVPPYCMTSTPLAWIDASAGTIAGVTGDDASATIPVGFTFNFYGVNYTEVTVSSNGYLTFGGLGAVHLNTMLPDPGVPNAVIAPFWDDLVAPAGAVTYQLLGSAPNRRLVVEWKDVPRAVGTGTVTFEVVLHEAMNRILLQYQDVALGDVRYDGGASATVGIENEAGSTGVLVGFNAPVLSNGAAYRIQNIGVCDLIFANGFEP